MKMHKIIKAVTLAAVALVSVSAFKNLETGKKTTEKVSTGPETGFAVIELFTSEGCSSCPPADALVARILKEDKDKAVYILGYHVDYWNSLGWKDEFSKAEYSERQRQYAGWLHSEQVYTPQIVVNGKHEFVGSDENSLRIAIQTSLQKPASDAIALSDVHFMPGTLSLQYQTKGSANNRALLIAFVQKNAQSIVKSGENSGHTLNHVNIVRNLSSINLHQSGNENIKLPAGFNVQTWEVVSFVQNTATGEIVSAQKIINQGV